MAMIEVFECPRPTKRGKLSQTRQEPMTQWQISGLYSKAWPSYIHVN